MKVELVWVTQDCEKVIDYCARVSVRQELREKPSEKLLKYCLDNKHWSIFEMANMCVEITTSRAISAQLLRHKNFSFQEFSQRYAVVLEFEEINFREQDIKNRQNSNDIFSDNDKAYYKVLCDKVTQLADETYYKLIEDGVAKECARMVLPMCAQTKICMNGNLRSWIHYLQLRTDNGTQKEHIDIANEIKNIFIKQFPKISEILNFKN